MGGSIPPMSFYSNHFLLGTIMIKKMTCNFPLSAEGRDALDSIGVGTLVATPGTFVCFYTNQTPQAIEDAARGRSNVLEPEIETEPEPEIDDDEE